MFLLIKASVFPHKPSVHNSVNFVSQFANPEWAEKILKDGLPKTSDPDWQQSGADTAEEYGKWVTTVCGMACTVMALDYFGKGEHKSIMLAKDALEHGVYQEHADELSAMRYREYVSWVARYGLSATLYSRLTVAGIQHILASGGLVIASVNPNMRGYQTAPEAQAGGHLVLVTGYEKEKDTITLENPSGFVSQNTHHNHTMKTSDFKRFFAGRGIALYRE